MKLDERFKIIKTATCYCLWIVCEKQHSCVDDIRWNHIDRHISFFLPVRIYSLANYLIFFASESDSVKVMSCNLS